MSATVLDAMPKPPPPAGPARGPGNLDLNLLVTFEALWIERSVTAAGRRLGLSQPATSAALARLRDMVGDRLFVRGKNLLEPTERCAELAEPLLRTLVDLRNVLASRPFDPRSTTREVRIGAVDAAIAVWIPRLIARVLREAPFARVHVVGIHPARAAEALDEGSIDLALSPVTGASSTVRSRGLYPIEFVAAVRVGHPVLADAARALGDFPRAHVVFEGRPSSVKAQVLLGSFLAVPPVLMESDAWATIPSTYAEVLVRQGVVSVVRNAPIGPPEKMTMRLLWPEAQDASPLSKWLRAMIVELTRPG
jgi:DNA-binding transcriptional LysR family regulator